ncbi:MAG: PleD family two-component system response regulator [Limisphaerales bacterium]
MAIRILSVDDSRPIRLIVTRALRPFDCEVIEASNGEEGLAMAARERPDLILLDVTMPVMDGVTMLAHLRGDPALKTIPVIMLTAESGRETLREIARLGVNDPLAKPFREEDLIERIRRAVNLVGKPNPKPTEPLRGSDQSA